MEFSVEDDLVVDVARTVVAQAAPHELPIFRATAAAYLKDPDGLEKGQKDEMLGFGVDSLVAITPCVLAVSRAVVEFVVGEVSKALKNQGASVIQRVVRRVFGKTETADGPEYGLSSDQLGRVRAVALEKAAALNVPDAQARLLADSMVGSLVSASR